MHRIHSEYTWEDCLHMPTQVIENRKIKTDLYAEVDRNGLYLEAVTQHQVPLGIKPTRFSDETKVVF